MRFDVVTVLPELLSGFLDHSIIKRAVERQLLEINIVNLRDYSTSKHKQVDDYQYGGGAGMVMMIEPLANCIRDLQSKSKFDDIIYLTPDGKTYDQKEANKMSLQKNLMIICGHYKGIDQRARDMFVTKEISIGDFVLSGGEIAAAVVIDSIGRLIPGVINDETSALTDSFQDGLLAPPVYTRPSDFEGNVVPEILLSGNEAAILNWRNEKAYERTKNFRPDLLME
ncbi:MAG: tRNA (guanosine(37)-N1)-methyltransferase TrmD [Chitinophagales bacterium]|nr:tRNA (guanosine(37)-N1)-methyltransferase TrmD [Chitinophagales bacterium]